MDDLKMPNQSRQNRDRSLRTRQQPPVVQGVRPVSHAPAEGERREIIEITKQEYRELFSGPLPHPDILVRYNEAHPGLANRIVEMAERQQQHRIRLESTAVDADISIRKEGLRYAAVIAGIISLGAVYLLSIGRSVEGLSAIIIAFGTAAATLIWNSRKQERERIRKAKMMAGQVPED